MQTTITTLKQDDKAQWHQLFSKYCAFYNFDCSTEKADTVWQWIFDVQHPLQALAAYDQQQLVGIAHYQVMPLSLFGANTGYLADLYIAKEARRQGVAKALHQAFITEGKQQGWPFAAWLTQEGNQAARNLYDQQAEMTDLRYYVQSIPE